MEMEAGNRGELWRRSLGNLYANARGKIRKKSRQHFLVGHVKNPYPEI